jgi:hypothetical protein
MPDFIEVLKGLPTHVSLCYADSKAGVPKDGGREWDTPPEMVVVGLQFSESGFGFGEITIKQTAQGVFLNTECMSSERVKKYLAALVDSAITDNDQDPEKHALYNEVMKRGCGPRCRVCFPEE